MSRFLHGTATFAESDRPRYRRFPWILGWLVGCVAAWMGVSRMAAAPLPVEMPSLANDLPSTQILDLDQDRRGRLWILHRLGVSIYDGHTVQSYTRGDGLSPTRIGAMRLDDRERPWVVSGWGDPLVYRLRGERWRPLPSPPPAPFSIHPVFLEILEGASGPLVVVGTGNNGLWLWRSTTPDDAFGAPEHPRQRAPSTEILAMARLGDRIAVGTAKGLCELNVDGELDCSAGQEEPRLGHEIHALTVSETADRLWIWARDPAFGLGAGFWLGYVDRDGKVRGVVESPGLPPTRAATPAIMTVDRAGGIYLGHSERLAYLEPDRSRVSPLGRAQGLAGEGATSLLRDRENGVWVGSSAGLNRLGSRRFKTLNRTQGLVEDEVTAVFRTRDGATVLGHNQGLTFLEGPRISTLRFDLVPGSRRNNFRVFDMAEDDRGNLWLATFEAGLLRVDPERKVHEELPEMPHPRTLAKDPQGRLWVAGTTGIYVLTDDGFQLRHRPEDLEDLRWMVIDSGGRFLLTTRKGLLMYVDGRWVRARGVGERSENLFGVTVLPSREVWVGSMAGPRRLEGRRLVPIGDGFPELEVPVFFLLQDPAGWIWIGTGDGVFTWDGSQLRHLTVRHGLAGRETNRGAGFVDDDGRVWIGTESGVSIFHREHDHPLPSPQIELVGIDLDGRRLPPDRPLELEYDRNGLTFHFRTVAFTREERMRVSYRLDGFDPEASAPAPIQAPEVRYTNLPPGEYRFRIRAKWPGGPWGEDAVTAPITILRPLWQTYPFMGSVLFLLVGTAVAFYKLRTRTVRARARELEAINRKLRRAAEERELLITDLEAKNVELERFTYTVSHDLKSPLVTIRGFLGFARQAHARGDEEDMAQDLDRIDAAASKMGRLLDELLELARVGRVLHPSERISLHTVVQQVVELATARIREEGIEVWVGRDLPEVRGDRVRLRMVLQNLLDNAMKFTHGTDDPRIEIDAEIRGERVLISVADNGVGIAPEHQEKIFGLFKRLDASVPGTGIGLALVRRIAEAHGGEVWVESAGEGQGSRFILALPHVEDV